MHDLLTTLILFGAAQGAALAVALALREKNRLANRLLAALIGALSLMLLLGVLERQWGFTSWPHLLGLTAPLPFLFAPLLYLYIVALTRPADRFEPRWLLHGLPFAADVVLMAQLFYLKGGEEKIALAIAYGAGRVSSTPLRIADFLLLAQAISYLVASWGLLRRYGQRIEGYFSDLVRIDLRWLKAMVVAHATVWSIVVVTAVLRVAGVAPASVQAFSRSIQVASALVVFLTGYVSLWQPDLFRQAQAARVVEPAARPLPKYQRNRLEEAEAAELASRLEARMREDKLYREGGLTLERLADAAGATPHMVSQVLNVHLRKSFFVFVNSYRAEELMASLADPRQRRRGILDLALDAGFNSKSTLNSFFKRYTGVTPSEFRALQARTKTARVSAG